MQKCLEINNLFFNEVNKEEKKIEEQLNLIEKLDEIIIKYGDVLDINPDNSSEDFSGSYKKQKTKKEKKKWIENHIHELSIERKIKLVEDNLKKCLEINNLFFNKDNQEEKKNKDNQEEKKIEEQLNLIEKLNEIIIKYGDVLDINPDNSSGDFSSNYPRQKTKEEKKEWIKNNINKLSIKQKIKLVKDNLEKCLEINNLFFNKNNQEEKKIEEQLNLIEKLNEIIIKYGDVLDINSNNSSEDFSRSYKEQKTKEKKREWIKNNIHELSIKQKIKLVKDNLEIINKVNENINIMELLTANTVNEINEQKK